jgi:membrane-associated phospholipid phosphatase
MRNVSRKCRWIVVAAGVVMLATAGQARAESRFPQCRNEKVLPFKNLFSATVGDLKRLPTAGNAMILGVGGVAAAGLHPADTSVTKTFSSSDPLEDTLEAGQVLGGFPLQIGGAFATYGLGRMFKNDCMAAVGGELVRAQFVAQILTYSIKGAVQRPRPEGGGYSFPSGHATAAFASATVLQRHFGWKVGLPAYGAATYVAAQRVQGKRHYLSDVAFGAALGVVAGRTVTMPGGHKMSFGPIASDFGPAAGLTLINK